MNNDQLDAHLDAILKAGGSALRHYTTQKSKDDMRAALLLAVLALQSQPAGVSDADPLVVAEFVGLLGPGSRVGESHSAAVRFARAILALRPQAVPMTEADLLACVVKANCLGGVPMSNRNGHYHIDTPSDAVVRLKDAIEAHHGITAHGAQGGEVDRG